MAGVGSASSSRQLWVVYGSKLNKPQNLTPLWFLPLVLLDFFDDFSGWNVQAKETSLSKSLLVNVLSQKQKSKRTVSSLQTQDLHRVLWRSLASRGDTDLSSHAPFTLLGWMHGFGNVHAWLISFNGNYHVSSPPTMIASVHPCYIVCVFCQHVCLNTTCVPVPEEARREIWILWVIFHVGVGN